MKTKILGAILFAAGVLASHSQSNPDAPDGVDTETELSLPNAVAYVNSFNEYETSYSGGQSSSGGLNWSEASGGTFGGDGIVLATIPGNAWPPPLGFEGWLNGYDGVFSLYYGSLSFSLPTDDYGWSVSGQGQLKLTTGGTPGTTGSELYELTGWAENEDSVDDYPTIPPANISFESFGNLSANSTAWAVLPSHSQVDVSVNVNSSSAPLYLAGVSSVKSYQLVSQCLATTPTNQSRTTIGVGEQVNLGFNPSLPINATWSASAGSLDYTNNLFTLFTAPSSAGSATVTATVQGHSMSITFNVVAPSGMVTASIIGTNHFPMGWVGAGMTDLVTVYPTNVSFYNVTLVELASSITNVTGYFTNFSMPVGIGSAPLSYANTYEDSVYSDFQPEYPEDFPLYPGGYEINTPVEWCIGNSTNSFGILHHTVHLLDSSGDFAVAKFGITITRSTNDVSFSTQ